MHYVTCIHSGLGIKINTRKKPHRMQGMHEDSGHILFAFISAWVVSKDLNTPNWTSMADDAITWGGSGVLVSPI